MLQIYHFTISYGEKRIIQSHKSLQTIHEPNPTVVNFSIWTRPNLTVVNFSIWTRPNLTVVNFSIWTQPNLTVVNFGIRT